MEIYIRTLHTQLHVVFKDRKTHICTSYIITYNVVNTYVGVEVRLEASLI